MEHNFYHTSSSNRRVHNSIVGLVRANLGIDVDLTEENFLKVLEALLEDNPITIQYAELNTVWESFKSVKTKLVETMRKSRNVPFHYTKERLDVLVYLFGLIENVSLMLCNAAVTQKTTLTANYFLDFAEALSLDVIWAKMLVQNKHLKFRQAFLMLLFTQMRTSHMFEVISHYSLKLKEDNNEHNPPTEILESLEQLEKEHQQPTIFASNLIVFEEEKEREKKSVQPQIHHFEHHTFQG